MYLENDGNFFFETKVFNEILSIVNFGFIGN